MTRIKALRDNQIFEESERLLKEIPFSKISIKLKGIVAIKNNNISKVSEVLGVSRNSLKSWVKNFDKDGIEGLRPKKRRSKKPKLDENQKLEVKSWIDNNPNLTLKEIRLKINNIFSISISSSGLWYNLKKMNLSYITARPKHHMQDKVKLDEFKKNSYQS
ncbi:MAG: winged helix-turn-helix domain-containing protein [Anaplasmataceae bacterium]|jgi:transposase|nr:winged helix-turn-helix domain-containing protein [Candidatus Heimdallarchaeota archaeon]MDH5796172.1 winged helix-turn-helix domain-containing protein [Anaplasmataceae bacterium]